MLPHKELNNNFVYDEDGIYGYHRKVDGADTVIPFSKFKAVIRVTLEADAVMSSNSSYISDYQGLSHKTISTTRDITITRNGDTNPTVTISSSAFAQGNTPNVAIKRVDARIASVSLVSFTTDF